MRTTKQAQRIEYVRLVKRIRKAAYQGQDPDTNGKIRNMVSKACALRSQLQQDPVQFARLCHRHNFRVDTGGILWSN